MGDTQVPDEHASHQLETSTSGRGEATANPLNQPRVSIVHRGNPRVPIGVPNEHMFGVDYLEPNKMTIRELVKLRAEYCIPDLVKMRILGPTESFNNPDDEGSVAVTTCRVEDPYPNRVALMGVIAAFGIVEEGEPSYEQFSYLYSVTKSKSANHGGWVQCRANFSKVLEESAGAFVWQLGIAFGNARPFPHSHHFLDSWQTKIAKPNSIRDSAG
ncbi:unnamed protein product [Prunus armeniaca]